MLTRALSIAGLALPQNMLGPNRDNPEGFWEPRAVVALNDELLALCHQDWTSLGTITAAQLTGEDLASLRLTARKILENDYGDAPAFVIKDPRMARLMPFWKRVLDDMEVVTRYVCCIRHPLEVARSLAQRDGLDLLHCMRMWTDHVMAAELASFGSKRAIVHFDAFMKDPVGNIERIIAELELACEPLSVATSAAIGNVVRPELYHHVIPRPAMELASCTVALTSEVYRHFCGPDLSHGAPELLRATDGWLALCGMDTSALTLTGSYSSPDVQRLGPPISDATKTTYAPRSGLEQAAVTSAPMQKTDEPLPQPILGQGAVTYNGYVDKIAGRILYGWCQRSESSERIMLRIRIDDRSYGPYVAEAFRPDLPGDGRHAFVVDLGNVVTSGTSVIRVMTWDEQFTLVGSGRTIDELCGAGQNE